MRTTSIIIFLLVTASVFSQQTGSLYDPAADAAKDLEIALIQAKQQNKNVLIQIGGNWCSWCFRLHDFMKTHEKIDSILKADYILIRINYSPENYNREILAQLDYPQRFGFPVLLILNQDGIRLHTQDTYYLEKDKSYDGEKLIRFLLNWNVASIDPGYY